MKQKLKKEKNKILDNTNGKRFIKVFVKFYQGVLFYVFKNMAELAAGKVAIYFGDFSEVVCRIFIKECKVKYNLLGIPYEIYSYIEFDEKLIDNNYTRIVVLKFKA